MTAQLAPLLHVAELFGPTIQGEGPHVGRPALFLRLGGCNLTCGPCDTPYTWDATRYQLRQEITPTPVDHVLGQLLDLAGTDRARVELVVITGGEPLLHQQRPALPHLVHGLAAAGLRAQFETNGTLAPAEWMLTLDAVSWVVSPKITGPLATDPENRRLVPDTLHRWAQLAQLGRATFKLVVATTGDVEQAALFADTWHIPRHHVWVMPEGATAEQTLSTGQQVADAACRLGLSITPRLHMLLWPNETRGR